MIYRQTANPNATNSELDAKIIIKHPPLPKYPERLEKIILGKGQWPRESN